MYATEFHKAGKNLRQCTPVLCVNLYEAVKGD